MKMTELQIGILLGILCRVCEGTSRFTFNLRERQKQCFHESFNNSKNYVLRYDVLKGGNMDVDVYVVAPYRRAIYSTLKKVRDVFSFESMPGEYSICFDNQFSRMTPKTIFLSLQEQRLDTLVAEAGNDAPTANTLVDAALENIHQAATRVVGYQTAYRIIEARGQYIADSLNRKVQWWSLGQSVIILIIGFGQIFVLKMLFLEPKKPAVAKTA